jgi:hypothetical protein
MSDAAFETLLSGELRKYAEAGVRPIDPIAIADETITRGRPMQRRRPGVGLQRAWPWVFGTQTQAGPGIRRRAMLTAAAAVVTVAVAGILLRPDASRPAVGGPVSPSPSPRWSEVRDFMDEIATICRVANDELSSEFDYLGFRDNPPSFATIDDAVAYSEEAVRIWRHALREIRALPAPEAVRGSVDRMYSFLESPIEALRQVPEAAGAGDTQRVDALMSEAWSLTNSIVLANVTFGPNGFVFVPGNSTGPLNGCGLPSSG